MIARISFALVALALLAHIFDAPRLPLAVAQDVLPTPVDRSAVTSVSPSRWSG